MLRAGDLLVSTANSKALVGKSCMIRDVPFPCTFGAFVTVLRPKNDVAPEFLAAWMRSPDALVYCYTTSSNTTNISNLRVSDLLALELPLPPIPEQKRIVAILTEQMTEVEKARAATEAQVRAAETFRSAWLNTLFSSASLGKWPMVRLGDHVVSYRNGFGRRPQGAEDGPIVLRLADITRGEIDLSSPRRVKMTPTELQIYRLEPGNLLFLRVNGSRDLVGRGVVVRELGEGIAFNDHLIRVILQPGLLPEYVRAVSETRRSRATIVELASTSAGQLTVNQDAIASLELPLPPLSEQQKITNCLRQQERISGGLSARLSEALEMLQRLPAALLRRAFNGEI